MPILRSKYQSDEKLEEFYKREEWEGGFKIIANNMLNLINLIDENFVETELIASTSHQRLCIQSKDDKVPEWLIIISNGGLNEYYLEYKVPEYKSPWKEAWMKGTAKDIYEAIIFLIKSMIETGNWKDNYELNVLKRKYSL